MNKDLVLTHNTFKQWESQVFHIEKDSSKIEPFLTTIFNTQVQPLFDYSRRGNSEDYEIQNICDEITFDVNMIEVSNENFPLIDKD